MTDHYPRAAELSVKLAARGLASRIGCASGGPPRSKRIPLKGELHSRRQLDRTDVFQWAENWATDMRGEM
eukprot:7384045-Alexandrium_andersonii.AAC.1